MVLSPEPEAPRTPESQEAEQTQDANQERLLAVEACRGPKRTRSHSADSRSEGASDIVESKEDVKTNHVPANENVELKHSTNPLSGNVDDRVCVFTIFLFRSIEFSINFIIISVILHFVLDFFPAVFLFKVCRIDYKVIVDFSCYELVLFLTVAILYWLFSDIPSLGRQSASGFHLSYIST